MEEGPQRLTPSGTAGPECNRRKKAPQPLQTPASRAIIAPIGDEEEQRPVNDPPSEKAVCAPRMLKAAPEGCGKFASELFLRNSSKRKRVGSVNSEKRIGKAVSPCGIWVVTRGITPSSHGDGGFFFRGKTLFSNSITTRDTTKRRNSHGNRGYPAGDYPTGGK